MKHEILRFRAFACALISLACVAGAAGVADAQSDRDDWQRVPAIVAALELSEGSRVADVGAGAGYFTEHLSRAVGEGGQVVAVDISERAIRNLRRLVRRESLDNVTITMGEADDPRIPDGSLDAALIVNAYHDMEQHEAMLAGILSALRPGGRLVVIDYAPSPERMDAPRHRQTAEHELHVGLAARELRMGGFEVVERIDSFAAQPHRGHEHAQWMLIARRPVSPQWPPGR